MRPLVFPLSASLLALSVITISSAAHAEAPAATSAGFFPQLTLTGQALCPSPAPSPSKLLPSLAGEDKARPMQVDGGESVWRGITMTWADDGSALATVYIFNQTIGTFVTDREYWYVNRDTLSKLGRVNVSISVTDYSTTTPPSDPGYSSEQKFTQIQNVSWGTGWTSDPVSGGFLYQGPTGLYFRFKTSTLTPPTLNDVIWYQVLSSGSPANLDPAGSWTPTSGSVSVPSGSTGYDINQTVG